MNRFVANLVLCTALALALPGHAQTGASLLDGERLAAEGDIRGALEIYRGLTEAQPDSSAAFAHLGGMQLLDQQYANAVKSFQQAISLGDAGTGSFVGMGMAYLHMGQHGAARAAFVEAKSRGSANSADLDKMLDWIDARARGVQRAHP